MATNRPIGHRRTAAPKGIVRRRRTAEEARRAILQAAQRRLAAGGPEAIRLQEIARDLGISHPAILHHFESRDGLMQALAHSAVEALDRELVQVIGDPAVQATPAVVLDRVIAALGESGLARLLGWYTLTFTPQPQAEEQFILRHVVDVLHTRLAHAELAGPTPSREEVSQMVRLAAVALLGDAIFGRLLSFSLGTSDDADAEDSFRRFLARLLAERLGLA